MSNQLIETDTPSTSEHHMKNEVDNTSKKLFFKKEDDDGLSSHKDAALTLSTLFTSTKKQSPDTTKSNSVNGKDILIDGDEDSATRFLQSNEVMDENSLSSSNNSSSCSPTPFITPMRIKQPQKHPPWSKHHYHSYPYSTPPPHGPCCCAHHPSEMMHPYYHHPPHPYHYHPCSYPPLPPHPLRYHEHPERNNSDENVVSPSSSESSKSIMILPFCTPNDKSNGSKSEKNFPPCHHPHYGPPPPHSYYYPYLYPPPPSNVPGSDMMYHHYHEHSPPPLATPNTNKRSHSSTLSAPTNNNGRKKQIISTTTTTTTTQSIISYSRKDKSLGLLTENFISTFSSPHCVIAIDTAATTLCVERRRIYDIINIFESVDIVSRKCKNTYVWHGLQHLPEIFSKLQKEAVKLHKETAIKYGVIVSSDELQTDEISLDDATSNSYNKEKSLGRLCQKFLQLFLLGYPEMNLSTVCEKIYEDKGEEKTKVRRLYDIANVMNSLGVVKKISKGNKPTFSWSFRLSPRVLWLQSKKEETAELSPLSEVTPLKEYGDKNMISPTSNLTSKNTSQPILISPESSQASSPNGKDKSCIFPSSVEGKVKSAIIQGKKVNIVSCSQSSSD